MKIIDSLKLLDIKLQSAIISAFVSILIFFIGWIFKFFFEKYIINYKLNKEYTFNQRKNIKEKLSITKTPLIKSAEELNYRLWNLAENIDKKWHNINEEDWILPEKYYLKSFTYRLLLFLYWIQKSEESLYSFDFSQADKNDNKYLKYMKTLKHFLCERELLEELNYPPGSVGNHFYKDELVSFTSYLEENGEVISFTAFEKKFNNDYSEIKKIVKYITNIENEVNNKNYNAIKSFHLFLMLFLNKYGLEYHKTNKFKFKKLIENKYSNLKIKEGLYKFLTRNKVKKEAKWIIKYLK